MYQTIYKVVIYNNSTFPHETKSTNALFETLEEAVQFAEEWCGKLNVKNKDKRTYQDGSICIRYYNDTYDIEVDDFNWITDDNGHIRLYDYPSALVFDNIRSMKQHIKNTQINFEL